MIASSERPARHWRFWAHMIEEMSVLGFSVDPSLRALK